MTLGAPIYRLYFLLWSFTTILQHFLPNNFLITGAFYLSGYRMGKPASSMSIPPGIHENSMGYILLGLDLS